MDLTEIVHYEREFPLALTHPVTQEELGVTMMVRHVDCEAATEVTQGRAAKSVLGTDGKADMETAMYAACIAGWDGEIEMAGEKITYSPENALALLSHPKCKWVFAQVRAAALKIGNFTDA